MNQRNFANVLISCKFPFYNKQINASRTWSVSKHGKFPFSPNLENACEITFLESRNAFQKAAFDLLLNRPVFSQPLNTWKATKALHLLGPKASKLLLMLIPLMLSPLPVLKIVAYSRINGESTMFYLKLAIKEGNHFCERLRFNWNSNFSIFSDENFNPKFQC